MGQKFLSVLKYLIFFPDVFCQVGKWLDKEVKINFKIFDVTNWETNHYNTHNTQYQKKKRQSDDEIWSVDRIKQEKYFP